uniref:CSON015030 protein n=1 Tax=Culicoides sonorensis TaxID=179676 RepID=A0A336LRH4_CULSO
MRAKQGDNVEFVLWTGDGLAHSARRLLEQHRIDLLRNITDLLGRTFPSQFVFPVLGHEDGHGNSFNLLGDLWRHWLPSEALQTFEKGGYYTIEQTKSRLRIIALNTNYMRHDPKYSQSHLSAVRQKTGHPDDRHSYSNTFYHHKQGYRKYDDDPNASEDTRRWHYRDRNRDHRVDGGTVSALSGSSHEAEKQWEWLESVLDKSKKNKETVYIIGHIPPGSDERQIGEIPNGHTTFSEVNNLRYIRLVRKYSSIIQGQFFGHLHSDSFRIVYDDGKPVSWMMVAPSLTPRKMNVGSNNPALRLYKFDTDTGQVLDYSQYYLDLASANLNNEPDWQLEYNLTYYYGLTEVTSVSLHNLADRFSNSEDLLFGKYYRANSVRHTTSPCEGVCALNHYCAITRVDYREYKECFQTAASALATASASRPTLYQLLYFNSRTKSLSSFLLTTHAIKEMLMFYFLIVMQLKYFKNFISDSCILIVYLIVTITRNSFNCINSVVSVMFSSTSSFLLQVKRKLLLPKTKNYNNKSTRCTKCKCIKCRNNTQISIILTSS